MSGFSDFLFTTDFISIAIGVAIGTAFTALITVLVSNLLTPLISVLTGNVDISKLQIKWRKTIFAYGACIDEIITFVLVCIFIYFAIFLPYSKLKEHYAGKQVACPYCGEKISEKANKCKFCTADIKKEAYLEWKGQ